VFSIGDLPSKHFFGELIKNWTHQRVLSGKWGLGPKMQKT